MGDDGICECVLDGKATSWDDVEKFDEGPILERPTDFLRSKIPLPVRACLEGRYCSASFGIGGVPASRMLGLRGFIVSFDTGLSVSRLGSGVLEEAVAPETDFQVFRIDLRTLVFSDEEGTEGDVGSRHPHHCDQTGAL